MFCTKNLKQNINLTSQISVIHLNHISMMKKQKEECSFYVEIFHQVYSVTTILQSTGIAIRMIVKTKGCILE